MTNLDRIQKMSVNEFIIFMKLSDFSGTCPIIEGHRCYTRQELIDWLNAEPDKPPGDDVVYDANTGTLKPKI